MNRKQVEAELRKARAALRKCVEEKDRSRERAEFLEVKVEEGAYPAFQTWAFRDDDLKERAAHRRREEELEARERELENDVRAWENTLKDLP